MNDNDFHKMVRREMRLAALTRERPIIRQYVLFLMEIRKWDLLQLWKDIRANPDKYDLSTIKQARKMFYSRRLREQDSDDPGCA
jgi:hypothetical protein